MSSTKVTERKGKHLDFYETPAKTINGLLTTGFLSETTNLLEPCAGKGAIVKCVRAVYPSLIVTAIEIQEEFGEELATTGVEVLITDFLKTNPIPLYDRIIANPPFSQAEDFILHSLKCLSPSGRMAFLLRLPFIAGVKRYGLFQEHRPSEVLVLSQRPKFGGDNIDSCDYAWIIWDKNPVNVTMLSWIMPSSSQGTSSSYVL